MPLNLRYVDEIHARLAVRYGSRWPAMWAGLEPELVKADWADQLAGMTPAGIKKALASLPAEFPPTCTAFRALGSIREEAQGPPLLQAPENFKSPAALEARAKLSALVARLKGSPA